MAKSGGSGSLFAFIAFAIVISIIINNWEIFLTIAISSLVVFLIFKSVKKNKKTSKTKTYVQKTYSTKSIPKYTQKQTIQYSPKENGVPHWSHTYIYSSSDLDYANHLQKAFYYRFKKEFLRGNVLNIENNTNYAFILYFDLIEEYQSHQNIILLEKQFDMLGKCCPKTKRYYIPTLLELLENIDDAYAKRKIEQLKEPSYQTEQGFIYDPESFKLGNKHKTTLNLSAQEQRWLNKFWNPQNSFTSIEGCCLATAKLYLNVLGKLNIMLKDTDSTIVREIQYFKDEVIKQKQSSFNSRWSMYDNRFLQQLTEREIYLTFFKRCENKVRKFYGNNRKVANDCSFLNVLANEFEENIGCLFDEILMKYENYIEEPDEKTQIELNEKFTKRWKEEFNSIVKSFINNDIKKFTEKLDVLEKVNYKNPDIENILYAASKFIAKFDKVLSLQYYAQYIHYDLNSKKIDNKPLNKSIQKSLFFDQKQVEKFENIINNLINGANIDEILGELSKFYVRERKKIKLDEVEVKEAELKHKDTVVILNEFLEEADEPEESKEIQINIQRTPVSGSIFKSEISLSSFEESVIELIKENSFIICQNEIEEIAINNGLLKNQLIDNINDKCNETLSGEVLIEEDEDNYIIEESYYEELLIK